MKTSKLQKGMVLISALLFITILSLLVISIAEIGLLETKMSKSYQDKTQAFYNVLSEITSNEQKLLTNQKSKFVQINDLGVCGVTFYRIDIVKTVGNASSEIVSNFAKFGDFSKCDKMPAFNEGRLGLKIL